MQSLTLNEVLSQYIKELHKIRDHYGWKLEVEEQRAEATLPPSNFFKVNEYCDLSIHPKHIDYWKYIKDTYNISLVTQFDGDVRFRGKEDIHKDKLIEEIDRLLFKYVYQKEYEQVSLF